MKNTTTLSVDDYEKRFRELWNSIDRVNQQLGGVGEDLGEDAENFFADSLRADKTIGGIRFDEVHTKVKGGEPGQQQEYDLILEGRGTAAVIEVKYKFRKRDLEQLDHQMQRIKSDFPSFRRKRLFGGIAAFSIPTEVAHAARARGYFVLRRRGHLMRVDATEMKEARV
jgi:predicted AAA+ superfamily ATPase